jgi:signal transduction histidine kinase
MFSLERFPLKLQAIVELANAEDVESGMRRALSLLRRATGAQKVEWWARRDGDDAPKLLAADGEGDGDAFSVALGPAGVLLFAGAAEARLQSVVADFAPLVRRRFAEEQLLRLAGRLARENQALEDFAALVAHELKTPLHAALFADDATTWVERALDLVDSILAAARTESTDRTASGASCLAAALADLGEFAAEVEADLPSELPLSPTALHLLLRNLVGNSVAAGARNIRIGASGGSDTWTLVVDDDGVGLEAGDGYASGSGIGLQLCGRLVNRLGGALELCPHASGGTRATVTMARAA